MSDSAQNKIPYVPQDTLDPAAGLNDAIRVIDALLNTRVENMTTDAPPGSPADGVCYIVGGAPTGAWAGHANALATYVADGAFWTFYEAGAQAWLVLNKDDGNLYKWNPATPAWEQAAGIGEAPLDGEYYGRRDGTWAAMPDVFHFVVGVNGKLPDSSQEVELLASDIPFTSDTAAGLASTQVEAAINELASRAPAAPLQSLVAACSDETTALTAGTSKVTFRNPYAVPFIVTAVKASLTTAQATGSIFTVDINEGGVSILSTKLTIDNTEKTSVTAATPPVISDSSIAADGEITVDIDQVGVGTAKGLKVYLIGHLL
jgi:hypothetical protein